jgi:alkanesulfonate monooxygenase
MWLGNKGVGSGAMPENMSENTSKNMSKKKTYPKMGWFIPTNGDTTAFGDPEKTIASSMELFEKVALAAEEAGFEYVLVPTTEVCWEAWVTSAYLAAKTEKLKFLVALKPGYIHPVQLAKMVATFDQISGGGRIYINLIAGQNAAEARAEGQRYEQMEEEIILLKELIASENVVFNGKHYHVDGPKINPKAKQKPYPPFFLGGGSETAAEISAKYSATHLFWGDYPERIGIQIKEIRARAAKYGRADEIDFSMRLQIICRQTEDEAWAFAKQLIASAEEQKAKLAQRLAGFDSAANDRQRELAAVLDNKLTPHLWSGITSVRPGAGTAVVGNPQQVAAQLQDFIDVGISGFCLSGYPHDEEAEIFGRHVMPLLKMPSG